MEKKKKQYNQTILIAAENVHSKSRDGGLLPNSKKLSLYISFRSFTNVFLLVEHLCQLEACLPLPGIYNYYKNKRITCHICSVHV